jgi:hypothetical protein
LPLLAISIDNCISWWFDPALPVRQLFKVGVANPLRSYPSFESHCSAGDYSDTASSGISIGRTGFDVDSEVALQLSSASIVVKVGIPQLSRVHIHDSLLGNISS